MREQEPVVLLLLLSSAKNKKKPSFLRARGGTLTWFLYQNSSTGRPLTRTSLRDPLGRSSGLRTGTQLVDEDEASAAEEEDEAAATAVVVVVAGKRERF